MTDLIFKQWKNTVKARRLAFFRQRAIELLDYQTFESYRVTTVGEISLLVEIVNICNGIKSGILPEISLTILVDELNLRARNDQIFHNEKEDSSSFILKKINELKKDPSLLSQMCEHLIETEWTKARPRIEEGILSNINSSDDRRALSRLVTRYVSHLLSIGYSRQHVLDCLELCLPITGTYQPRVTSLTKFFSSFSDEKKRFECRIGVSKDTAHFCGELPFFSVYDASHWGDATTQELTDSGVVNGTHTEILTVQLDAHDPHSAAMLAKNMVQLVVTMTMIGTRKISHDLSSAVAVRRLRSAQWNICKETPLRFGPMERISSVKGAKKNLVQLAKTFFTKFERESFQRLGSAFDTLSILPRETKNDARLLSLWSAKEIICGDPPRGAARISHYIDCLVPIISYRYQRRLLAALNDQLQKTSRFRGVLRNMRSDIAGDLNRLAALLLVEEFSETRESLLSSIAGNPLLVYRVEQFMSRMASPALLDEYMNDHRKRVSFQIHRMYRARNSVVHKGQSPRYLDNILIEAFDYTRTLLLHLYQIARKTPMEKISIEECIFLAKIGNDRQEFFLDKIKKNEKWTESLVVQAFSNWEGL